jgi:hypothetical protein
MFHSFRLTLNVQIWEFAVFAEIIPRIFSEVYLLVKGRTYPSRQHLTCNLQYTYPLPCLFQYLLVQVLLI